MILTGQAILWYIMATYCTAPEKAGAVNRNKLINGTWMGISTFSAIFQRVTGWCEVAGQENRTHPGVQTAE